jgi:hypothetical protein
MEWQITARKNVACLSYPLFRYPAVKRRNNVLRSRGSCMWPFGEASILQGDLKGKLCSTAAKGLKSPNIIVQDKEKQF